MLSRGQLQIRGDSALLLLDGALFFRILLPSPELQFPLDRITALGYTKSFLGKACLRPLLRIDFITDHGTDAAAFALPRPREWKKHLENTLQFRSLD